MSETIEESYNKLDEYQEGRISAKENAGDVAKVHNPHIAGTTSWQRWNAGWNDYEEMMREEDFYNDFHKTGGGGERQ